MSTRAEPRASRAGPLRAAAAALAAALATAACAPMHTAPGPAREVDPAALGAKAVDVAWPAVDWWRRYRDPQLDALIDEGLAGNPTLASARARVALASAAAGVAGAALLPQVSGNGTVVYQRFSENYIFPPPFGGSWDSDNRLTLDLAWEIDFWNRNAAAFAAALSQEQAAAADAQAARVLLAAGIARAYFDLQRLFAQREVSRATIAQRARMVELTAHRFEAGLDTRVEVKQAEASLATVRTEFEQSEEAIATARHRLAALAGAGPARGDAIAPVGLDGAPAATLPPEVPLDLLGRRAEIVALRWRIEAAHRNVDVARAMFYPNVNLVALVGFNAIGFARLFDLSSGVAGVGPAIHLPIFEGGRLNANLSGREADVDLAVSQYNQAVVDAAREVADALSSIRALGRIVAEQSRARAATNDAYALAVRRYEAGLGNYLTVLTAQTQQLVQDRLDADLRARAFELDVALARALGGGYAEPAASHAGGTAGRDTTERHRP